MADIHSYEPLFGAWYLTQMLGKGSYGSVYKARRREGGRVYYSAIKHISIEGSPDYPAEQLVQSLAREVEISFQLRGDPHFVGYEDSYFAEKPNRGGYDAFIRMELLTPLTDRMKTGQMSEIEVVRMGVDICGALVSLEQRNILHRDIKPENIFIGSMGEYKLGDFGVARSLGGTTGGMTIAGTFNYMAPEIYRGGRVNQTADIYSLGMVLYRMLNAGRAPFMVLPPETPSYDAAGNALSRRMSGEPLPAPAYASPRTANIILKACAYDPRRRFQSAYEFENALLNLLNTELLPTLGPVVYGQDSGSIVYGGTVQAGDNFVYGARSTVTAPSANSARRVWETDQNLWQVRNKSHMAGLKIKELFERFTRFIKHL